MGLTTVPANQGAGAINLSGFDGRVYTAFTSTPINSLDGVSGRPLLLYTDAGGGSSDLSANGSYLQFEFSMDGYEALEVTFAEQGDGGSAGIRTFRTGDWTYSLNGTDFFRVLGSNTEMHDAGSWTISSVGGDLSVLGGAETAYLRLTLSGATQGGVNTRLDNIQFNATVAAILEPTSVLLGAVLTTLVGLNAGRRR